MVFERTDAAYSLTLEIISVGGDICAVLSGGEAPHIGSAVLAVSRPSLQDEQRLSSTSSVLNLVGHKDEGICRLVAEEICAKTGRTTVCTGGFHDDNISGDGIERVLNLGKALAQDAVQWLGKGG